ncbi:2'-5' RNA ligase family protein [Nocardia thailandica]
MAQSVELLVDPETEAWVRGQWRALAAAGVGRPGTATHRPHITVAVAARIPSALDPALAGLDVAPLPVRIGGLLLFGAHHPILVRAVVPSAGLLALQRRVHDIVAECPGLVENTAPDSWTPHVTLARRVTPEQLGAAVHAVARERDFPGTVVGIRRWDGDTRTERILIGGR